MRFAVWLGVPAPLHDRRQLLAGGGAAGLDGLRECLGDLLRGRAAVFALITSAGTFRCLVNGLPVQDRSPQRFSRA
jgi:hypothetical protein